MEPIVNKVAESPIKVVNLEEVLGDIRVETFDIADHLENGFILREKELTMFATRENLKGVNVLAGPWSNKDLVVIGNAPLPDGVPTAAPAEASGARAGGSA